MHPAPPPARRCVSCRGRQRSAAVRRYRRETSRRPRLPVPTGVSPHRRLAPPRASKGPRRWQTAQSHRCGRIAGTRVHRAEIPGQKPPTSHRAAAKLPILAELLQIAARLPQAPQRRVRPPGLTVTAPAQVGQDVDILAGGVGVGWIELQRRLRVGHAPSGLGHLAANATTPAVVAQCEAPLPPASAAATSRPTAWWPFRREPRRATGPASAKPAERARRSRGPARRSSPSRPRSRSPCGAARRFPPASGEKFCRWPSPSTARSSIVASA